MTEFNSKKLRGMERSEPMTPHQERLNSRSSSSLSILSLKGRGRNPLRHPAAAQTQHTEVVALRDLKRKVVTKKENKTMKLNNNKAVAQTHSRNGLNVLADLRMDGVPKAQIRIANRLSRLSRKAFRRNSVSVEQIQKLCERGANPRHVLSS